MDHDSLHSTAGIAHRLIHEIKVRLFRTSIWTAIEDHFPGRCAVRKACLVNAIQKFKDSLSFDLRECFTHGLSDNIFDSLSAGESHIVVIDKCKPMLGS